MGILKIHTPNEDDLDRVINDYYRNYSEIHEYMLDDDTYNDFLTFTNDFFFDILNDAGYLDHERFIHKYGNLNTPDLIWLIITEYKQHHNVRDEFVLESCLNRQYQILWMFLDWNYTENMQTLLDYASIRFYLTTPLYRIIPQCSRINGELHYEMRVHM